MPPDDALEGLPGAALVIRGCADLRGGVQSVESLLVWSARTVLAELGWAVPAPATPCEDPELRLYALVGERHPEDTHAQYNALRRRVDKFLRAAFATRRAGRSPG